MSWYFNWLHNCFVKRLITSRIYSCKCIFSSFCTLWSWSSRSSIYECSIDVYVAGNCWLGFWSWGQRAHCVMWRHTALSSISLWPCGWSLDCRRSKTPHGSTCFALRNFSVPAKDTFQNMTHPEHSLERNVGCVSSQFSKNSLFLLIG